jgi:hypothetical protein
VYAIEQKSNVGPIYALPRYKLHLLGVTSYELLNVYVDTQYGIHNQVQNVVKGFMTYPRCHNFVDFLWDAIFEQASDALGVQ